MVFDTVSVYATSNQPGVLEWLTIFQPCLAHRMFLEVKYDVLFISVFFFAMHFFFSKWFRCRDKPLCSLSPHNKLVKSHLSSEQQESGNCLFPFLKLGLKVLASNTEFFFWAWGQYIEPCFLPTLQSLRP